MAGRYTKPLYSPPGAAKDGHVNNGVMFQQFLQAEALDTVQLDTRRFAGMNEILAVLLPSA